MSEEKDPLGSSWKIAGGALALIIVAIVAVLFLIPPSQNKGNGTPASPSSPQISQAAPPNVVAGGCPSLSTDKSFPIKAPATQWLRHPSGMILPTSGDFGPAIHDGNFWRCYSRTPSGALMAGVSLMFSFSSGGAKQAAADSPERDKYFDQQSNATAPAVWVTIEGFRILTATEDAAVIEYYGTQQNLQGTIRVNLLWDEGAGDWRLDLASGSPLTTRTLDSSVFTRWR